MIATFTSFGSRASLALAFSARNAANAWPYWSEWICARNTYCRFWSLNTEVAIAVVIQRIFFCASTLAASGTACALAYTPSTISIFSWLISRSTSLIAASALLCESALIGCTLYLPSTPPRSLTMSIAICAPIAQGTEHPRRRRAPTHPKPVGHPCDEVGFCPSRQPLFGLLIGSDVTQPGRQQGIEASSTSDELARSVPLGLAVAEPERVP